MSGPHLVKPTLKDIEDAASGLKGVSHVTPLEHSHTFSTLAGNDVYLKLENLQKTGSFKLRGAFNKIAHLSDEDRLKGVIAASAGNHAQGVAYAAGVHHAPCTIVMPESASLAKIAATQRYGAKVVLAGHAYDDAYATALELQNQYGYTFVHAFDDPQVIAGQGTVGLEILKQLPSVDAVVVPMGGGGLASGLALAVKSVQKNVRVIGVQAANASAFYQSFAAGVLTAVDARATIADGIAVKRPGTMTYELAKQYVDEIITVEEEEIARSMVLLLERNKLVAEGAAASALASVLYQKVTPGIGNVVVVLSGGNVDVTVLSRIIEHGLVESGRYLRLALNLADTPGALRDLLDVFAGLRANVLSVLHRRVGSTISLGETEVEVDLETKDQNHIQSILESLQAAGYQPAIR